MSGSVTRHVSYCRLCFASCGILVDVDDDGVAVNVVGDPDHPLTRGFSCAKGRRIGDFASDPDRLRQAFKREPTGDLDPMDTSRAIAEAGARISDIVGAHGPDSIALYLGTHSASSTLCYSHARAWFRAIGSNKLFSPNTFDQSAKLVRSGRLGDWEAGPQRFDEADVWLCAGTNPLVSLQAGSVTPQDPFRRLAEAKARGLRLIVIDPRRTELASRADLHLQPLPGTDVLIFAALLHVIFDEALGDEDFWRDHVSGVDELRSAVSRASPAAVAHRVGLGAQEIVAAARLFGTAGKGMVTTGTGPDMGPWSNAAEHLAGALNVVCGRYPREGERRASQPVMRPAAPGRAQVLAPRREWETGFKSRIGGIGVMAGELPSGILADEILRPGEDQVRALVVMGGNPAASFPDQIRTVEALSSLELLVVVDPYLTETARLADYVIAPALPLERADHTRRSAFSEPFAQYTPAVLAPPPGVIEDWEFFVRLAAAMGLELRLGRRTISPDDPVPTAEESLTAMAERSAVPYDEIRRHRHGRIFSELAPSVVEPPNGEGGRFDLLPADVATDLAAALSGERIGLRQDRPFHLVVRREKETMNTLGRRLRGLPRAPHNPCFVHPDDLADLGLRSGDEVSVSSDHGRIVAVTAADPTLRRGVVAMTHGYGDLPDREDHRVTGSNTNRLLTLSVETETINAMPRMTAVPVSIEPLAPQP